MSDTKDPTHSPLIERTCSIPASGELTAGRRSDRIRGSGISSEAELQ
jgi:hypothetical protein